MKTTRIASSTLGILFAGAVLAHAGMHLAGSPAGLFGDEALMTPVQENWGPFAVPDPGSSTYINGKVGLGGWETDDFTNDPDVWLASGTTQSWVKTLTLDVSSFGIGNGVQLGVQEYFQLFPEAGTNVAITDWHFEILTTDWVFRQDPDFPTDPGPAQAGFFPADPESDSYFFNADPLTADSTTLDILFTEPVALIDYLDGEFNYTLTYVGSGILQGSTTSVSLAQYPTVMTIIPEPSFYAFGLGAIVLGMVALRRRRG